MSKSSPSVRRINGARFRIGVVAARFNEAMVDGLLAELKSGFRAAGVIDGKIKLVRVPGSHEVPWAVGRLAASHRLDCVVALGVLIGGDTNHHEMVGQSVSHALQRISLRSGIPVINGVIVADTVVQARARCTGKVNRGAEFARAALEVAELGRSLGRRS